MAVDTNDPRSDQQELDSPSTFYSMAVELVLIGNGSIESVVDVVGVGTSTSTPIRKTWRALLPH
jgi:hypothetical protein